MKRIQPSGPPLDLNLLWTLGVLLEERSVRAASVRLGVTPSAVSHALRRLREALGDELFVRAGRGLVPTARAEALAESVWALTRGVRDMTDDAETFDPLASDRRFVLSMPDQMALAVVPSLMAILHEQRSRVSVVCRALTAEPPYGALERGDLDLAVGSFRNDRASPMPAGLRAKPLWRERLVCVVREGHPVTASRLTLEGYARDLDHLLVAPRGATRGIIDRVLEEHGLARRIALVVAHHVVAPFVVARTDLVVTISRQVALTFSRLLPLRVLAPPVGLEEYGVTALWHERAHRDPGHTWMRGVLQRAARQARAELSAGAP
ncbi:MAG: LysR family transcriptional regulator [Myxococcales bacterium]|nr:LysR family transcriptional regulator [Myxococcales bacterium]